MSSAATARRLRAIGAAETGPRLEGLSLTPGAHAIEPGSPPDELVPRPRLVARLVDAATPVALVAAPAGYGKTTLIRQWEQCDERAFAWVSLDVTHERRGALAEAIERALDRAAPVEPRLHVATARSGRSAPGPPSRPARRRAPARPGRGRPAIPRCA